MTNGRLAITEERAQNDAAETISFAQPYGLRVKVTGTAPMLLHGWSIDAIKEKSAAAKNSKAKKTDDLESYVYRTDDGRLGYPGVNFVASIREAGRYMQDPRSPRKSAMDLCREGIIATTVIAPFEPDTESWDYEDARRVVVQRSGVTRIRPAMREGWTLTFDVLIVVPEYLTLPVMAHLTGMAGRLKGIGDFRPTFGRFAVQSMQLLDENGEPLQSSASR